MRIKLISNNCILLDMDIWEFVLTYIMRSGVGLSNFNRDDTKLLVDNKEILKPPEMEDDS